MCFTKRLKANYCCCANRRLATSQIQDLYKRMVCADEPDSSCTEGRTVCTNLLNARVSSAGPRPRVFMLLHTDGADQKC